LMVWLLRAQRDQPVYGGRPLMNWVNDLANPDMAARARAEAAIRALGTNAVPTLGRALRAPDPPFKDRYLALQPSLPQWLNAPLYRLVNPFGAAIRRMNAARALTLVEPSAAGALDALAAALEDPDARVVADAAEALARIGKPAVPALVAGLGQGNRDALSHALAALGRIGPEAAEAIPAVLDVLIQAEGAAPGQAAHTLWRLGPGSMPLLYERLTDAESQVRDRAVEAITLQAANDYGTLRAVLEGFSDQPVMVRRQLARALRQVRPPTRRLAFALVQALEDPDPEVREQVAAGLQAGMAGFEGIAAALEARLGSADPDTRRLAASVLATLGPASSKPAPVEPARVESPPSVR